MPLFITTLGRVSQIRHWIAYQQQELDTITQHITTYSTRTSTHNITNHIALNTIHKAAVNKHWS